MKEVKKYFDNNGSEVFYEQYNINGSLIRNPLYNAEILQLNNPNGNAQAWYNSNIYLFRITLERYEQRYYSFSYTVNVGYTLNINITLKSEKGVLEILYTASDSLGNITYEDKITDRSINYPLIDIRLIPVYYANCLIYVLDRAKQSETSLSFDHNVSDKGAGVMFNAEYNGHTFTNDNGEIVTLRDFDSTGTTGEEGGGYGTGKMPHDNIDIPPIYNNNLWATGSTTYVLTEAQMNDFTNWLWTDDWTKNLRKLRTDPMENIISVGIADFDIPTKTDALIFVGNITSSTHGSLIQSNFVNVDCGTIDISEYYGSFADYAPYVVTTLYLPKVGFIQIPADEVVNNSIHVVYHIEVSSGEGICYVQLINKRDGFKYIWNTYSCICVSSVSLSESNHTQMLIATSNAIINTGVQASGALVNPLSTPSALSSIASSVGNVATTKNPTITKGNIGNMSSIMCNKIPYLLIQRTNLTKPSSFKENNGYIANYTGVIGNNSGFLKTRDYHAEFNAPSNFKIEIERLMNEGVFING